MATLALDPAYRRVSVEEFLAMDFGGAKAELEDGVIFMMAGGTEAHARIAGNLFAFLHRALRGSGCRPYGSDFATQTGVRTLRFPDISVYCGGPGAAGNEAKLLLGDPQTVIEVLSPSTSSHDQKTKLSEYRELSGVREIVFVDPQTERMRVICRTGYDDWSDRWADNVIGLELPSLQLTIPHAEIFARD